MQRPEGDRYLLTQSELESRIQVLLAGTVAEEIVFGDVSTGAQNDLERATEIARSMVMDFGMSRLGRVTYRESRRPTFLAGMEELPGERTHSEQTAREIDEEISTSSPARWSRCGTFWKPAGRRWWRFPSGLIEQETIDSNELKRIIEANSPSPMIVPGTEESAPRKPADDAAPREGAHRRGRLKEGDRRPGI